MKRKIKIFTPNENGKFEFTKQELEDALPVLKSTIEFCCTPPTQNMHSANQKRTHQVARPGEDTIQYLKNSFQEEYFTLNR